MVALSMTRDDPDCRNPYMVANLVLSLSSLPSILMPSWDLRWVSSILPLSLPLLSSWPRNKQASSEELSTLPPLHFALGSVLTHFLHPSLTQTELRMISAGLINLFIYASSPQAVILKAVLWGGGLGVIVLCEDVVPQQVSQALWSKLANNANREGDRVWVREFMLWSRRHQETLAVPTVKLADQVIYYSLTDWLYTRLFILSCRLFKLT